MNIESELKSAIMEYELRHYDEAFSRFKKIAKKGENEARYYLGLLYFYGRGTNKNLEEAYSLFSQAAIDLHAGAIFMKGMCFEEGKGTAKDLKQAYEYYVASEHQGNQDAAIRLAHFYENGIVVAKDFAKAIELYVELAKKDNPYAMYKIGIAYFTGNGIKKSLESAYSWLNKALMKGSVDAMNHFRLLGTKSATDIRETQTLFNAGKDYFQSDSPQDSIIYFEIAAKEGILEAYRYLQKAYDEGMGVNQSLAKAFDYAFKAASLGDPISMMEVAKRYEEGLGVESSFLKAEEWYLKAFKSGALEAKTELFGLRGYLDE